MHRNVKLMNKCIVSLKIRPFEFLQVYSVANITQLSFSNIFFPNEVCNRNDL